MWQLKMYCRKIVLDSNFVLKLTITWPNFNILLWNFFIFLVFILVYYTVHSVACSKTFKNSLNLDYLKTGNFKNYDYKFKWWTTLIFLRMMIFELGPRSPWYTNNILIIFWIYIFYILSILWIYFEYIWNILEAGVA